MTPNTQQTRSGEAAVNVQAGDKISLGPPRDDLLGSKLPNFQSPSCTSFFPHLQFKSTAQLNSHFYD